MKQILATLLTVLVLTGVALGQSTHWKLDKAHSGVNFSVAHLVISEVTGIFSDYDVTVASDKDDFTDAKVNVVIKTASINTQVEKRDQHLRSDDFFNSEKFPDMTFVGKKIEKIDNKKYVLVGDLTIRDITKEMRLDVVFGGVTKDPWGNTRAGFKVTGEVDRFAFGLKWNAITEAGGLVAGETIQIVCNIEIIKPK